LSDSIIIRKAEPGDEPQVVALLQQIFSETGAQKSAYFDGAFWRWQTFTPGFEALVAAALDGERIVGCFHLVSRAMYFYGQRRRMVSLQDLAVLPEYRRHRLFLRLAQYAIGQCETLNWDITYSLPNHRSYPGFIKHLAYTHVDTVPLYLRPLQPGNALADRFPLDRLWQVVGRAGMWPYNRVFRHTPSPGHIEPIPRFTSEIDPLSYRFVGQAGIGCVRDAAFLNWRFTDHPAVSYESWGLRWEGDLAAYVVTRQARLFGMQALLLMDMAGEPAPLITLIEERLRSTRDCAVAVTMGLHPFIKTLRRSGFVTVPNRLNPRLLNLIVRRHTQQVTDAVLDRKNWCLTLADWDVF
jgi:GNAT superfamily N-acetyltransferase